MIAEDYVSYEVAKLLKEKGFDGQCFKSYNESVGIRTVNIDYVEYITKEDIEEDEVLLPTHQMAMKWLREMHKINLHIVPFYGFNREYTDNCKWIYGIDFKNERISLNCPKFNSYEEACNNAIMHCIKNLIH